MIYIKSDSSEWRTDFFLTTMRIATIIVSRFGHVIGFPGVRMQMWKGRMVPYLSRLDIPVIQSNVKIIRHGNMLYDCKLYFQPTRRGGVFTFQQPRKALKPGELSVYILVEMYIKDVPFQAVYMWKNCETVAFDDRPGREGEYSAIWKIPEGGQLSFCIGGVWWDVFNDRGEIFYGTEGVGVRHVSFPDGLAPTRCRCSLPGERIIGRSSEDDVISDLLDERDRYPHGSENWKGVEARLLQHDHKTSRYAPRDCLKGRPITYDC